LARGATEFFCYRDGAGERIRFILARDEAGHVAGIFDACRQCYTFHKGYTVSGHYVVCRLCGNRYRIADMRAGKASCVPAPLRVEQRGDRVEVNVADLKKGRSLF
ncbi:MAG TPA: Fe-S-containing protein, partial [Candidatus Binataceae bacterium]|nr:Fe-S-containing protein [Candidatus Binataceae bacterium]